MTAIIKSKPDDFLHYFEEVGVLVEQNKALIHGHAPHIEGHALHTDKHTLHIEKHALHTERHVGEAVDNNRGVLVLDHERTNSKETTDIAGQHATSEFRTPVSERFQPDPGHFVVSHSTENGHTDLEVTVPVAVECSDDSDR
jgi:hypothetical protein